jgi:histone H1/5
VARREVASARSSGAASEPSIVIDPDHKIVAAGRAAAPRVAAIRVAAPRVAAIRVAAVRVAAVRVAAVRVAAVRVAVVRRAALIAAVRHGVVRVAAVRIDRCAVGRVRDLWVKAPVALGSATQRDALEALADPEDAPSVSCLIYCR